MSQIKVNEIYDASGGSAAKLYGPSMRYGGTAFVNRIINGDMRIDQRNSGASVTPGNGAYTLDRWQAGLSQASKYTVQQNAAGVARPAGFTHYLGITSSSAYAVTASDYFNVRQNIEGLNVSDLGWGTSNAQAVTVSFWVRSSLTGTFGGSVYNSYGTRSCPFSYTISAANTWEYKTVQIAGDTSGTWLTDTGIGLSVGFGLGAGSSFSGTAGTWASSWLLSATGATSIVGTSGATFYITGVQLEAGSVATPFERRPYGTELALCQRYYQGDILVSVGGGATPTVTNRSFYCAVNWPVQFRASPTLALLTTVANSYMNAGAWVSVDAARGRFSATNNTANDAFLECVYSASAEL